MFRIALLISFISISLKSYTQHYPDSLSLVMPRHAVKFSPLNAIGFYPSVQFAYEYKISEKFAMQTDIGYVFNNGNFTERFLNKRGVKLRQELRRYYDLYHKSDQAYYYSLELNLNAVNFDRMENRVECFDLDCTQLFSRQYNYMVRYRTYGFSLKNGFIKYFSSKFFIDTSFGLTLRNVRYIKPELPPAFNDGNNFGGWFNIPNENDRIGIAPLFNFKLCYRIK